MKTTICGSMSQSRIASALQINPVEETLMSESDIRAENVRLTQEIAQLRLRLLDMERAADTDPLVNVFNRRAFMRELGRAQSVNERYDLPSCLIFFDLNGFKSINDRFGHGIGDDLLKRVGSVLVSGVRHCDVVARLGGDEFGVLLFKTDVGVAKAKAATLACRVAEQSVDLPTGRVSVTTAWGVAPCDPGDTPKQILARADREMYMAKQNKT